MFQSDKRRRPGARSDSGRNGKANSDWLAGAHSIAVPWLTLAIGVVSALLVALVVDGGDRPFPYQLGRRVDRDVRLRETLTLYNETKTRQQREENASHSLTAFVIDRDANGELVSQLAELLRSARSAKDLSDVDKRLRNEWSLTPEKLQSLKQLAAKPEDLEPAISKVESILSGPIDRGILDPSSLPTNASSPVGSAAAVQSIEVWTPGEKEGRMASVSEASLSE
jgi:hypothetical protein